MIYLYEERETVLLSKKRKGEKLKEVKISSSLALFLLS